MLILVTGATGFLGHNICRELKAAGYRVRATGRNEKTGDLLSAEGFEFVSSDLASPGAASALVADCDAVVHCAALSSAWGQKADFYRANVLATEHLVAASLVEGIARLVHISTSAVYFDYRDRLNIKEDAPLPLSFVNDYASTKREAEQCVARGQLRGLETVVLRPRGIFGEGDISLFPRILRASRRGFLPIPKGGRAVVDITYVENVSLAVRQALEAGPHVSGKTYNITNVDPREVKWILNTLFLGMGRQVRLIAVHGGAFQMFAAAMETTSRVLHLEEPVLTSYTAGLLGTSQTLNIDAAQEDLGYQPRISLAEGIDRFAAYENRIR